MYLKRTLALLLTTFVAHHAAFTQIRLPRLIADNMVLQRDTIAHLNGWASPGENITIRFLGKKYHVTTDAAGTWSLSLSPAKAGGPYTMDLTGRNHILLHDIFVGDVWFCSGQSNMVLPMERVKEKYPVDIADADYPAIRNFFIPTASDVRSIHTDLPPSTWIVTTPKTAGSMGAATFFFARQLYRRYHVPIGIINASVGGSEIKAWISENGFKDFATYKERIRLFKDSAWFRQAAQSHPGSRLSDASGPEQDPGLAGPVKWYDSSYVPQGWHPFWLPGYWADQGVKGLNGVVWFRKEIDLPPSMAGKPLQLFLGRIVDADITWFNGARVGNITYQYPPRRYSIPAGLARPGKNLLLVRITNFTGKGGFVPDKRYELTDGNTAVDLRGDWSYKVGQVFTPEGAGESSPSFSAQDEPTGLYNAMVAPVTHTTIRGFIWYQGEANTYQPDEYRRLLSALISDWRQQWKQGALPFLFVQLPNFMEVQYSPSESQWAELREAQRQTLAVPNTAMVVTIDLGEWNDIHPLNKKDVGERLALAAENLVYGERQIEASGPLYQSAHIEGDKIFLRFTHTGGGLMIKGDSVLHGFSIAGADKKFKWAEARIIADQIIVSGKNMSAPRFVRYAWADNPEDANLYSQAGLPASPFTTENEPDEK